VSRRVVHLASMDPVNSIASCWMFVSPVLIMQAGVTVVASSLVVIASVVESAYVGVLALLFIMAISSEAAGESIVASVGVSMVAAAGFPLYLLSVYSS